MTGLAKLFSRGLGSLGENHHLPGRRGQIPQFQQDAAGGGEKCNRGVIESLSHREFDVIVNTAARRVKDLTRVDSNDVVYGKRCDAGSEVDLLDCCEANERRTVPRAGFAVTQDDTHKHVEATT